MISPERWPKIKELFFRIREETPDQRALLLEHACADDPDLRAEVESLLTCADRPASFLDKPAWRDVHDVPMAEPMPSMVGQRIKSYIILRELGVGGMGVVYEARHERTSRVVAMKVMSSVWPSPSSRRQFEQEWKTLGRQQHPGVAQIYDADTYTEGKRTVSYCVMELVPGAKTITEYASANGLDLTQRIELFIRACKGVNHAHQKGIIHRDLKPANILVSEAGEPKVIDFGIARIIDPTPTVVASESAIGPPVGTLPYMSPEQVDGGARDLDVRSDVYALGVVLFELLCGQLPYDLRGSDLSEAVQIIKERPPRTPSSLCRSLRGDLDTIILRCLEKGRDRRYQSVAELASDLRRHLRHRPIEARRDEMLYVLWRIVYLHRAVASVAAVFVLGLIVFAVSASVLWHKAAFEQHRASVRLGRMWSDQGNPLYASEILWREFAHRDSNRTRFALWEFYLKYPRAYATTEFGPQIDIEYSPSGRWLASITKDGRLVIYDANTGTARPADIQNLVQARCVKFSPVEPYALYVGDADGHLRVWSFDDSAGRLDKLLIPDIRTPIDVAGEGSVACLAVSPCGTWLAAANPVTAEPGRQERFRAARVRLWNVRERQFVREWFVEDREATAMTFSKDAGTLAMTFSQGDVRYPRGGTIVWDTATGLKLQELHTGNSPRRGAVFSEDGWHLYSAGDYLLEWDKGASEEPGTPEIQRESVYKWGIRSLAASGQVVSRYLALAGGDGSIRFYDAAKGGLLVVQGYHDCEVAQPIDVCVSPDGCSAASVGPDGLAVWRF